MVSEVEDQQRILISLPFEILCRVALRVDYADLLALRLSCKALHEVTKARQIWYNFIDDLVRNHKITVPEEELESYTTEELEKWVVPRNRAKELRQGPKQLLFRSRILEEDVDKINLINHGGILPGGRWLMGSHKCSLYFYDLDAPVLKSQLLLDPETTEEATVDYSQPWIDGEKKRLTFYVATRVASPTECYAVVHCVELVGHGAEATLSANTLVTLGGLKKSQENRVSFFAVNNQYYIEIWDGLAYVCSYQKSFVQRGSSNQSVVTLPFQIEGSIVGFIQHNVFAFYAGQDLHLFEIAPPKDFRPPHAIQLLHTLSSVTLGLGSGMRWMPGASHMVSLDKGLLTGVYIPHDKILPPALVELGRYQPYNPFSFLQFGAPGISTSLIFTDLESPMEVVTHFWNDSGLQGDPIRKPTLVDLPEWVESSIPIMWSDDLSRMLLLVLPDDNSPYKLLILDLV